MEVLPFHFVVTSWHITLFSPDLDGRTHDHFDVRRRVHPSVVEHVEPEAMVDPTDDLFGSVAGIPILRNVPTTSDSQGHMIPRS